MLLTIFFSLSFYFSWVPVYTDSEQRLAVMSIGFLLNSKDDAVVWRGPKKNGKVVDVILSDVSNHF